jgi:NADH-quinone oxidoreductase subunit L
VTKRPGLPEKFPLIVLSVLAIVAGYFKDPLLAFLQSALPPTIEAHVSGLTETGSTSIAGLLFLVGLFFAYVFHLQKRSLSDALVATPVGRVLHQWWFAGWGFDWVYERVFVRPFVWISSVNKSDVIDAFYTGVARTADALYRGLSSTENGRVRWYAAAMGAGSVLFVAIVLLW